jgi:hypothetical protein
VLPVESAGVRDQLGVCGGGLFAHQNGFINSDTFVFALSVSFRKSLLMRPGGCTVRSWA